MKKRRIWIVVLIPVLLAAGFLVWHTWFRVQPLMDLLSPEDWRSVQAEHHPADGTDAPVVHVSPEGLAAGLEGVDVKRSRISDMLYSELHSMPGAAITFWLHTGPGGTTYELAVGQDGYITYAEYGDLAGTRTYWKTTETGLYEALLPLLPEAE